MVNLANIMELKQSDIDEVVELTTYGSMVTITSVINELKGLEARIEFEEKIKFEGKPITKASYEKLVERNFSTYIFKAVFKEAILKHKVFFKIENTEPGIDLIYSAQTPGKLFKWIADIDARYCLMRLVPTNIIYIRDSYSKQVIGPYLSEKGNYYLYNEEKGKIEEIM